MLPTFTLKELFKMLLSNFCIGDSDLALERLGSRCIESIQHLIHVGIHPADKKGCNRSNRLHVVNISGAPFEGRDESFSDQIILSQGKHQRNIDIDDFFSEFLES